MRFASDSRSWFHSVGDFSGFGVLENHLVTSRNLEGASVTLQALLFDRPASSGGLDQNKMNLYLAVAALA